MTVSLTNKTDTKVPHPDKTMIMLKKIQSASHANGEPQEVIHYGGHYCLKVCLLSTDPLVRFLGYLGNVVIHWGHN